MEGFGGWGEVVRRAHFRKKEQMLLPRGSLGCNGKWGFSEQVVQNQVKGPQTSGEELCFDVTIEGVP